MNRSTARRIAAMAFATLLAGTVAGCAVTPSSTASPTGSVAPTPTVDAVEEFYRGKTITLIVGSSTGGGFDAYARLVAEHIGKYIPGNPNVIVENMPGAGSLTAANHIANVAAKDGTVIGHTNGGLFMQYLLGAIDGFEHDPRDWYFLGFPSGDSKICFVRSDTGITSIEQVMNPGGELMIVSATAPGTGSWDTPKRLMAAMDLNIQVVDGYEGTGPEVLAVEQGETHGICGLGWESFGLRYRDRVESGEWNVIVQVTLEPIDDPLAAGAPLAIDLVETELGKNIIRYGLVLSGDVVRAFHVSPDVPADRAATLRQAFAATLADAEFLADAETAGLAIDLIPGETAASLVADLFEMPEDVKDALRQIEEENQ